MSLDPALLTWMLDSDPALRWQVERDLAGVDAETWNATRSRVATEGFGARLLALQDPDGQWAGGAYFPADFDFEGPEAAEGAGQPYSATTWSLNSLREWGVDASALGDTAKRLDRNSRWEYENLPYWGGEVDCCINSWTLANGAWLGVDVAALAKWFLDHRMPDGGWNCEWENGSTRSSFHSTSNSLRGLLFYETATGESVELRAARHAGEEYLLERRLLFRLSTGGSVADWATRFVYPFRWFYSALNAVDYFRSAALHDGTAPDPRLAEAVEVIRSARQPDGTWMQERRHPGRVWFEIDVPAGSRRGGSPSSPPGRSTGGMRRRVADVTLHAWTDADLPVLERSNTPEMTRYLGGPESPEKLRDRQAKFLRLGSTGEARMFTVHVPSIRIPVGSVGYWQTTHRDAEVYETGWSIASEFQGRGFATAAVLACLDHAAEHGDRRAVLAFPRTDNAASNALCRRAGFVFEGGQDFEYPPGHPIRVNAWRADLPR